MAVGQHGAGVYDVYSARFVFVLDGDHRLRVCARGAACGAITSESSRIPSRSTPLSSTAILMPVYNESPHRVFAGLQRFTNRSRPRSQGAAFDFFVLSDTTDPDVWLAEELAWARLNQAVAGESRTSTIGIERRTSAASRAISPIFASVGVAATAT